MRQLVGGDVSLLPLLGRAMIHAIVSAGEYYNAIDESGDLIGFAAWMPPGRDLFETYVSLLPAVL